jgi:hypothetical protein
MAHFIGTIEGSRGSVTRLGTPSSGINTVARGWDLGVSVQGSKEADGDVFTIYADSGSNGRLAGMYIGTVKLVDGKVTFIPAKETNNA